jgi:hypothetical protein
LGAVALLATACPASTSDGVGANATELTLAPPTGSDADDDTGSAAPPEAGRRLDATNLDV